MFFGRRALGARVPCGTRWRMADTTVSLSEDVKRGALRYEDSEEKDKDWQNEERM